jgi:hypothetical protein
VFAERSTLTIAHRLDTIIFSDKILAMAQGQVGDKASCTSILTEHSSLPCVWVMQMGHATGLATLCGVPSMRNTVVTVAVTACQVSNPFSCCATFTATDWLPLLLLLLLLLLQVKEFDKPSTLLQDPSSMFNRLVEDTGPVASAMLRQMAAAGPPDAPASEPGSRGHTEGGAARASCDGTMRHSVELPLPPAAPK